MLLEYNHNFYLNERLKLNVYRVEMPYGSVKSSFNYSLQNFCLDQISKSS